MTKLLLLTQRTSSYTIPTSIYLQAHAITLYYWGSTFQQLWADVNKLHFLPQVALVQLPDAGDEGVLLCCAAGHPTIHLLKVQVKLRVLLQRQERQENELRLRKTVRNDNSVKDEERNTARKDTATSKPLLKSLCVCVSLYYLHQVYTPLSSSLGGEKRKSDKYACPWCYFHVKCPDITPRLLRMLSLFKWDAFSLGKFPCVWVGQCLVWYRDLYLCILICGDGFEHTAKKKRYTV